MPIDNEPALKIETIDGNINLVIADIHLGFEESLKEKGVNLPSQTSKLATKVRKLITRVRASRIIILGDLKHKIPGISKRELVEIITFLESIRELKVDILLVPGNHDGGLVNVLKEIGIATISDSRGILITLCNGRKIGLAHGHTWPNDNIVANADVLVMGHTHPVIEFFDSLGYRYVEPVWVKVPLDINVLKDKYYSNLDKISLKYVLVMPHFNNFLSGNVINRPDIIRPLLGPLLESEAAIIENSEIFLLDGTYLGTLENVRFFTSTSRNTD